jgi:hypothetical protein
MAMSRRVDSGIRQRFFLAFNLSMPNRIKAKKLMARK